MWLLLWFGTRCRVVTSSDQSSTKLHSSFVTWSHVSRSLHIQLSLTSFFYRRRGNYETTFTAHVEKADWRKFLLLYFRTLKIIEIRRRCPVDLSRRARAAQSLKVTAQDEVAGGDWIKYSTCGPLRTCCHRLVRLPETPSSPLPGAPFVSEGCLPDFTLPPLGTQ